MVYKYFVMCLKKGGIEIMSNKKNDQALLKSKK